MVIKSKTMRDSTYTARRAAMENAKRISMEHCVDLRKRREAVGAKRGEGRTGGIHRDAFFAAIRDEGPEVVGAGSEGWWNDQKRLYPWIAADGNVPDGNSANGHYGRHGKVKERYTASRGWEHWSRGAWRRGMAPGSARGRLERELNS